MHKSPLQLAVATWKLVAIILVSLVVWFVDCDFEEYAVAIVVGVQLHLGLDLLIAISAARTHEQS